jgi:hypothetical protein
VSDRHAKTVRFAAFGAVDPGFVAFTPDRRALAVGRPPGQKPLLDKGFA